MARRETSDSKEPSERQVDEWVAEERAARQKWLEGPSEEEIDDWIEEERLRRALPGLDLPADLHAARRRRARLLGDLIYGVRGLLYRTLVTPEQFWDDLVGTGEALSTSSRRRRIEPEPSHDRPRKRTSRHAESDSTD